MPQDSPAWLVRSHEKCGVSSQVVLAKFLGNSSGCGSPWVLLGNDRGSMEEGTKVWGRLELGGLVGAGVWGDSGWWVAEREWQRDCGL